MMELKIVKFNSVPEYLSDCKTVGALVDKVRHEIALEYSQVGDLPFVINTEFEAEDGKTYVVFLDVTVSEIDKGE